jgi:thiamine kinase-like enzyme
VRAEEIAAHVWPGRDLALEVLGGGITNRNFKVVVDGDAYVLRIGGKDTQLLGIDRSGEHAATRVAAELGVGPEVVVFLEDEGCLVTRFIPGRAVPVESVRRPDVLRSLAATLRRVHDGPAIPGRFDSFRVVETYAATASERGVRVPPAYEAASGTARQIETLRRDEPLCPCHNDLLNANLIDDGASLRIVDWEYAGMGDRFFDLANFSINHELGEEDNELLLESYFGELRAADLAALRLMRFMSDFREAMWGVVQQGVSELDFDFAGYAKQHFGRLARTAAHPAFRAALAGESGA